MNNLVEKLGGWHRARFVIRSAKQKNENLRAKKRPCKHCPFRKDRPRWMTFFSLFMNQLRVLRYDTTQACHVLHQYERKRISQPPTQCVGIEICKRGGNDMIMSFQELLEYEPCPDLTESKKRYETK